MDKFSSFLESYNDLIKNILKEGKTFNNFYRYLKNNEIKSNILFDYDEAYLEATNYKKVLDCIISIIFKPHIQVQSEDIILRSELSKSLSPNAFKDTIKDSKLWKRKGSSYSPEYVHNEQFIDTIVTYENSFIAMLLDLIEDAIKNLSLNLTPAVKSFEEEYEIKGLSFGKRSMLNEFEPFLSPYENVFKKEKTNSLKVYNLLLKLLKRIKNIKTSEFYRFNKDKFVSKHVNPTNILLHDTLYSYCYRFYLDRFLKISKEEEDRKNILYHNYFFLQLLTYFASHGIDIDYDSQFTIDKDDKINFEEIEFDKGIYKFHLRQIKEINAIEVEVNLMDGTVGELDNDRISKYLLVTSYKFNKANKPYIQNVINENKDKYQSVILITQINALLEFINVCNISIYSEDNMTLIKNLISSMTLIMNIETDIYKGRCPICGKKQVSHFEKNYICESCQSEYALIDIKENHLVWIKSFRRK